MADHGFGTGKLKNKTTGLEVKATKTIEAVAQCIANIKKVEWVHIKEQSTTGTQSSQPSIIPMDYHLLWEMSGHLEHDNTIKAIKKCADTAGCTIDIHTMKIQDRSFPGEKVRKHPS